MAYNNNNNNNNNNTVTSLGLPEVFALTFHRSQAVEDHEDPDLQFIAKYVAHSDSCSLFREGISGNSEQYLLALKSLDPFAISTCFLAEPMSRIAYKLYIETDGVNVATPSSDYGQDYFLISGQVQNSSWIEGVATEKKPRIVRQFVALAPDTGHSLRAQSSLAGSPPSIKIRIFAGDEQTMQIHVVDPDKRTITLNVYPQTMISELRDMIDSELHPNYDFNIFFHGAILGPSYVSLRDRTVIPRSTLHIGLRRESRFARSHTERPSFTSPGYVRQRKSELEVGPGGLIEQHIVPDNGYYKWRDSPIKELIIRIVNPASYQAITGLEAQSPEPDPNDVAMMFQEARLRRPKKRNGKAKIRSIAEHEKEVPSKVELQEREITVAVSAEPDSAEDRKLISGLRRFLNRFI